MRRAQIEKEVPIPKRKYKPLRYCWDKLEIGDSILVEDRSYANSGLNWARGRGMKFVSRQEEDSDGPVRVWRIA